MTKYNARLSYLVSTLLLISFCQLVSDAQVPIACDQQYYFNIRGGAARNGLYNLEIDPPFNHSRISTATGRYNGFGFNPIDSFIYAIQEIDDEVIRVDANGAVFSMGTPAGMPSGYYFAGDISPDGQLCVCGQGGTLVAIDVSGPTARICQSCI